MSRWERIEDLFTEVLARAPASRPELLAERCAGDSSLRRELEAMIEAAEAERTLAVERLIATDRPDPHVGRVIGRWKLTGLLGRGGMGAVYRAERADGHYRQQAALKLISSAPWSAGSAGRFRTERQVLAQLSHPHIARLLDGGLTDDDQPFLVMELVEGVPITSWCASRGLSVEAMLRLFVVVCEAVQHAHGRLVVHRDLKPANALVTGGGDVKLLDFGVAKLLAPEAFGVDDHATRDQTAPATLEYAAPEQLFGGAITTAADVYSLGVLLYEMLTRSRPLALAGKSPVEIERAFGSAAIERPSRRIAVARADDLDSIVLMALRAQPERRYVSAGQLGEDIGRYLTGRPVLARPDTLAYRTRRLVGRNRAAAVASTAFALALAGVGIVATCQAHRATAARDAAQRERDKAEKVVGLLVDLFETTNPTAHPEADKMSIREFLAHAKPRVLEHLADESAVRARMRQVFGLIHAARDELTDAREALEQALAEQRELRGPDDPEAIDSLYHLGLLRRAAGDDAGAEPILREALERSRRVHGEDSEAVARTLLALVDHRDPVRALALAERAYAIRRRVLPPGSPALAETLGVLAVHYRGTGDRARARELYVEALAVFHTPKERRDPRALALLNDFAVVLGELGADREAEAALRESIEIARAVYGPESLAVARGMHNLGVALMDDQHRAECERIFRDAYRRHRAVLGESHWETVNVARDLAWTLALMERYDAALSVMDDALAALARGAGGGRPMRFHMEGRRALILHRLGRTLEAISKLETVLAAARAAAIPDNVIADLELESALVLLESGRTSAAEPHARAALAGASRPEVHALARCLIGWSLTEGPKLVEGRALLADWLPRYRAWGMADPRTVVSLDRALAGARNG